MYERIQFSRSIPLSSDMVVPHGFDSVTVAWVNAVIANGGTVSASRKILVNNLAVGLRGAGLLSKLDRLWLLAAENSQSALTDLIGRILASAVAAPSFTVDRGYTFNGSTNYVDTLFRADVGTPLYSLNSAHLSTYCRVINFGADNQTMMGVSGGGENATLSTLATPTTAYHSQINDSIPELNGGNTQVFGMGVISRTASNVRTLYQNGYIVATDAQASVAVPINSTFTVGAVNNGGVPEQFGSNQVAAASIGSGLTASDVAALTSYINIYMTAIGANVF